MERGTTRRGFLAVGSTLVAGCNRQRPTPEAGAGGDHRRLPTVGGTRVDPADPGFYVHLVNPLLVLRQPWEQPVPVVTRSWTVALATGMGLLVRPGMAAFLPDPAAETRATAEDTVGLFESLRGRRPVAARGRLDRVFASLPTRDVRQYLAAVGHDGPGVPDATALFDVLTDRLRAVYLDGMTDRTFSSLIRSAQAIQAILGRFVIPGIDADGPSDRALSNTLVLLQAASITAINAASEARLSDGQSRPQRGDVGGAWPQFQYDAGKTGFNPNSPRPGGPVGVRWVFESPGSGPFDSPVAVSDGTVFASVDDYLHAIDAATGEEVWKRSGIRPVSAPAVASGQVMLGIADGSVAAIDAVTGNRRWLVDADTTGTDLPDGPLGASPAVADGAVFVGGRGLTALEVPSGRERWTFATDRVVGEPAVADGTAFLTADLLYAIHGGRGTVSWTFDPGRTLLAGSAVRDGRVYVADVDGNVYGLDARTGRLAWDHGLPDALDPDTGIAVGRSALYLGTEAGTVVAVDRRTEVGTRWRFDTGAAIGKSVPTVVGDTVVVGCGVGGDGAVYGLDRRSGAPRWAFHGERGRFDVAGAVVDGVVFAGTRSNRLYALRGDG